MRRYLLAGAVALGCALAPAAAAGVAVAAADYGTLKAYPNPVYVTQDFTVTWDFPLTASHPSCAHPTAVLTIAEPTNQKQTVSAQPTPAAEPGRCRADFAVHLVKPLPPGVYSINGRFSNSPGALVANFVRIIPGPSSSPSPSRPPAKPSTPASTHPAASPSAAPADLESLFASPSAVQPGDDGADTSPSGAIDAVGDTGGSGLPLWVPVGGVLLLVVGGGLLAALIIRNHRQDDGEEPVDLFE